MIALAVVAVALVAAIFAELLMPHDPEAINPGVAELPPALMAGGEHSIPALMQAMDSVLDEQASKLAIQRRHIARLEADITCLGIERDAAIAGHDTWRKTAEMLGAGRDEWKRRAIAALDAFPVECEKGIAHDWAPMPSMSNYEVCARCGIINPLQRGDA
jgi:hypothetical protein